MVPVCYFLYPYVIKHMESRCGMLWGLLWGNLIMCTAMWLISIVFMVWYDHRRVDSLKLGELRLDANNFVCYWVKFFTGRGFVVHIELFIFLVLTWQFFPPYSVLSKRAPGQWGFCREEFILLALVNVGASIFWSSVGLLNLWWTGLCLHH